MMNETTPKNAPARAHLDALLARRPVMLAPMEDVTDLVFRRLARGLGRDPGLGDRIARWLGVSP